MRNLLRIDRVLIGLFGLMSGAYKVGFGEADIVVYAALGFSPTATAGFGAVQLLFGLACFVERTRRIGAVGLVLCNTVATAALFAAGIQPFGWISWVFVGMAALVWVELPAPGTTAASTASSEDSLPIR